MATMKRISIQMPGGQAELSSSGCAQAPKKQSAPWPRSAGAMRSSRFTSFYKDGPLVTPCSDGGRVTRIYYYKYADGNRSPGGQGTADKKLYLSTSTCGFDSPPKSAGRTQSSGQGSRKDSAVRMKGRPRKAPAKWASADHNLLSMNYHLSELSLHYRAPSDVGASHSPFHLRNGDKEVAEITEDSGEEADEIVSPPPPPSSSVPSPRETLAPLDVIGGSATTSSCPIPDPEDFVQKSTSNRLLNVISIDECHMKHRRARRRVRTSRHDRPPPSAVETEDNERSLIPEDTTDCPSLDAGSMESVMEPQNGILNRIERLHGFRSVLVTPGGGSKAQQLFSRRNQLLREQMNVYVAWRTSERFKERFEKMRGRKSPHGLLEANKEERLKAFSAVLRSKQMEFEELTEPPEGPIRASEDEDALESDDLKEALLSDDDDDRNKLTRMWEALQ